eukprot:TRINITY_DN12349_c0_g1_i1.p1 TRINITY_DN12349_c0_g1~~TRINITY_DN12349_c0_g1_i1.p1  ORF type:complete len:316 (+),score=39.67 TRINITY_DN12349_c0_g1_i1:28-948(+)
MNDDTLNIIGAIICLISMFLFLFVKNDKQDSASDSSPPSSSSTLDVESRMSLKTVSINVIPASNPSTSSATVFNSKTNQKIAFPEIELLKSSSPSIVDVNASSFELQKSASPSLSLSAHSDSLSLSSSSTCSSGTNKATLAFGGLSELQCRLLGSLVAIIVGVMNGHAMLFAQYLKDNTDSYQGNNSSKFIDYSFSHLLGIYISSSFWFLVYCCYKRFEPVTYSAGLVQSILSGCLWATAQILWFSVGSDVPFVITFPVLSVGPGVVGACWGVLYFREVKGRKNLIWLGSAISVAILGCGFIAASA